jgi:hypothetical protein
MFRKLPRAILECRVHRAERRYAPAAAVCALHFKIFWINADGSKVLPKEYSSRLASQSKDTFEGVKPWLSDHLILPDDSVVAPKSSHAWVMPHVATKRDAV